MTDPTSGVKSGGGVSFFGKDTAPASGGIPDINKPCHLDTQAIAFLFSMLGSDSKETFVTYRGLRQAEYALQKLREDVANGNQLALQYLVENFSLINEKTDWGKRQKQAVFMILMESDKTLPFLRDALAKVDSSACKECVLPVCYAFGQQGRTEVKDIVYTFLETEINTTQCKPYINEALSVLMMWVVNDNTVFSAKVMELAEKFYTKMPETRGPIIETLVTNINDDRLGEVLKKYVTLTPKDDLSTRRALGILSLVDNKDWAEVVPTYFAKGSEQLRKYILEDATKTNCKNIGILPQDQQTVYNLLPEVLNNGAKQPAIYNYVIDQFIAEELPLKLADAQKLFITLYNANDPRTEKMWLTLQKMGIDSGEVLKSIKPLEQLGFVTLVSKTRGAISESEMKFLANYKVTSDEPTLKAYLAIFDLLLDQLAADPNVQKYFKDVLTNFASAFSESKQDTIIGLVDRAKAKDLEIDPFFEELADKFVDPTSPANIAVLQKPVADAERQALVSKVLEQGNIPLIPSFYRTAYCPKEWKELYVTRAYQADADKAKGLFMKLAQKEPALIRGAIERASAVQLSADLILRIIDDGLDLQKDSSIIESPAVLSMIPADKLLEMLVRHNVSWTKNVAEKIVGDQAVVDASTKQLWGVLFQSPMILTDEWAFVQKLKAEGLKNESLEKKEQYLTAIAQRYNQLDPDVLLEVLSGGPADRHFVYEYILAHNTLIDPVVLEKLRGQLTVTVFKELLGFLAKKGADQKAQDILIPFINNVATSAVIADYAGKEQEGSAELLKVLLYAQKLYLIPPAQYVKFVENNQQVILNLGREDFKQAIGYFVQTADFTELQKTITPWVEKNKLPSLIEFLDLLVLYEIENEEISILLPKNKIMEQGFCSLEEYQQRRDSYVVGLQAMIDGSVKEGKVPEQKVPVLSDEVILSMIQKYYQNASSSLNANAIKALAGYVNMICSRKAIPWLEKTINNAKDIDEFMAQSVSKYIELQYGYGLIKDPKKKLDFYKEKAKEVLTKDFKKASWLEGYIQMLDNDLVLITQKAE